MTDSGGDATPAVSSVEGSIREGKAEVLPNKEQSRSDGKTDVFYNPAQVFNRDLSITVLSVFARLRASEVEERRRKRELKAQETGKEVTCVPKPGLKILEALAATGIRSIRYCKELGDSVRKIVANDLDPTAVAHMRRNMAHNQIPEGKIEVTCEDANSHMYARRAKGFGGVGAEAYDVIDLDPYGTCAPFLDAAVQAVGDGGLLCITSTDMPVLGGNHPETCFARYGGTALKTSYVHEMSLRLVVHAVATAAARYGREVVPMMSCSIDFYVRVFVRVFDAPVKAKHHASKTGFVHQCVQCESFFVQPFGEVETPKENSVKYKPARIVAPGPECPECEGKMKIGGPFHLGPLFDASFVQQVLEACDESAWSALPGVTSWKKVKSLATTIIEEHADLALHYRLPQLCKSIKVPPIPLRQFKGTLKELGYRVSHFHREPEAVKTDAPNAVVFDLLRLWAEEHPPKPPILLPALLKKELTLSRPVEWRTEEQEERRTRVPRFLPNPEKNWGPKPRAGRASAGCGAGAATPEPATDAAVAPLAAATAEAPTATAESVAPAPEATALPVATAEGAEANAATAEAPAAKRRRTDGEDGGD